MGTLHINEETCCFVICIRGWESCTLFWRFWGRGRLHLLARGPIFHLWNWQLSMFNRLLSDFGLPDSPLQNHFVIMLDLSVWFRIISSFWNWHTGKTDFICNLNFPLPCNLTHLPILGLEHGSLWKVVFLSISKTKCAL